MPLSHFQTRISQLCEKAVAITDSKELEKVIFELRTELRSQLAYLRNMVDDAKQTIAQMPREAYQERRKADRRKIQRRNTRRTAAIP